MQYGIKFQNWEGDDMSSGRDDTQHKYSHATADHKQAGSSIYLA